MVNRMHILYRNEAIKYRMTITKSQKTTIGLCRARAENIDDRREQ